MDVISINRWDEDYEVAQSRRGKPLMMSWVPMKIVTDTLGYRKLVQHPDGFALFGIFGAVVQIAAHMPRRGILADRQGPLTVDDISLLINAPSLLVDRAIEVLAEAPIEWLLREPYERAWSALLLHDREDTTDKQTYMIDRIDRSKETDHECFGKARAVLAKLMTVLKPKNDADGRLLGQTALAVAIGILAENAAMDAIEGVRLTKDVRNPFGLFTSLLREQCERSRTDYGEIAALDIPAEWQSKRETA